MTTPKPDGAGPTGKLKPCPFCGQRCVPEPRMDAFIISHGCKGLMHQLSAHSYDGWQNAYCWKLLAAERAEAEKKIRAYREGWIHDRAKYRCGKDPDHNHREYAQRFVDHEAERLMKEETK